MAKTLHATLAALLTASALIACTTQPDDGRNAGSGAKNEETAIRVEERVAPPSDRSRRVAPSQRDDDISSVVGDRIFFDTDKADIRDEARAVLDRQAAWLRQHPDAKLIIEGHADERGTREYNLALGDQRAAAVRAYFVALGVRADRLRTVSYGKERPAVVGSVETAWAQNRRAVSVVE